MPDEKDTSKDPSRKRQRTVFEQRGLLAAFLGVFIVITAVSRVVRGDWVFVSSINLFNILLHTSMTAIAAVGCTMILVSGNVDLSIGRLVSMAGIASVYFANISRSMVVGLIAAIAIGALVGAVNGFVVVRMKVNSLIATLGTMSILFGLVYILSQARSIPLKVPALNWLGTGYVGPVPFPAVVTFGMYFLAYFFMNRTIFGIYVYATGGSNEAAARSGINIDRVKYTAFVLSGVTAALAGVILAGRLNSGQPRSASGFELEVIAATILGGTSLSGGEGHLLGTIIGVLLVGVMSNGLIIMDVDPFWQHVVSGFILILAVYFDQRRKERV
jgi:ribose/xylose/arabinose/galactoside ABC-type transport system permease subunit